MPRLRPSLVLLLFAPACAPQARPEPPAVVALPPASHAPATPSASAAPGAPVNTAAARAPAPAGATLPPTHPKVECHAGERRFFACSAKEGAAARRIVVCAADLGTPGASLALVFGDANRTEDEIRVPLSADGALVRYARYTRPRVTYLHIEMKRGAEVWDLSDDASDEGPKTEWSSELALRAPGRDERTVHCTSRSRESLMGLEEHLTMAPPWF